MPIKIKVNLPYDIYRCLLNDMDSFGFKKTNGSINKNAFINVLFQNFFQEFSEYEKQIEKKVSTILQKEEKNITYNLISLINESNNNSDSIQFILSKANEDNFCIVEKYYLKNRSISKYFRDMFIFYASRSQNKRELILFKDQANIINNAIQNHKKIIIINKKGRTENLDPYALTSTKEELYNYLVAILSKKIRKVITYKLYKIEKIIILDEDAKFSNEEVCFLKKTIHYGAQFPVNEDVITKISFTTRGLNLLDEIYLNKPTPIKIENNIYYYDCALNQIEFYFLKFGEHIKILEPEFLQKRFCHRYASALKQYKKEKITNK